MKRNGKIDLLRFIFALFIMFLHYGYRPELSVGSSTLRLGQHGETGVTFFFVVSGYLLAKSVERLSSSKLTEEENRLFLLRKYLYYCKWYIPAFISCVLLGLLKNGVISTIKTCLCSIQNLLLLGSLGFSADGATIGYYVGASWYVSALFCAQIILFPIMRRNYNRWISVISPMVFVFLLSMQTNGHSDRILVALLRIILGGWCYETVKWLNGRIISRKCFFFLRISELMIWAFVVIYMCSDVPDGSEYGIMFLIAAGVILSFSKCTEYSFFNKPIFVYFGKLSFPFYLLHIQVLHWGEYVMEETCISLTD